eukprot:jgi/Mesvir1/4279/Mv22237-RA.1
MDRVLPAISNAQDYSATALALLDFCQVTKAGSPISSTQAPAGVKVISGAMLPHVSSQEICSLGLQALTDCAKAARQTSTVLRLEGGVKTCIAVLREHSQRPPLVAQGLRLLSMVSYSALTCVAIAKEKGFPDLLFAIMRAHLACAEVVAMAAELVAVVTRQEKALRLFSADLLVATAKAVTGSTVRDWAAVGNLLRVMKNFAKLDDARKELSKAPGCLNFLMGTARLLVRAPGQGQLLKRASRVAWLLSPHVLVPLPPFDLRWKRPSSRAGEDPDMMVAAASSVEEDFRQRLYPEDAAAADYLGRNLSSMELPPAVTRAKMAHFGSIPPLRENGEPFMPPSAATASLLGPARARLANSSAPAIAPGGAGGRVGQQSSRGGGCEDEGEPFHCGDDAVVGEAILRDLSRIVSPSALLNEVVYDETSAPPVMLPSWQLPSLGGLLSPGVASKHSPDGSAHSSPEEHARGGGGRTSGGAKIINLVSPSGGFKPPPKPGSHPRQHSVVFSLPSLEHVPGGSGKAAQGGTTLPAPLPAPEPLPTPPSSHRIKRSQSVCVAPGDTAPVTNFHHAALECPPLLWESRFESGNLRRAVRVQDREYDLVLREDTNDPMLHFQWFFFAVANAVPGKRYRFNVVNMGKKDSLYNEGLRPLMWKQESAGKTMADASGQGGSVGHLAGIAVPLLPHLPLMEPPVFATPSRRSSADDAVSPSKLPQRSSRSDSEGEGVPRVGRTGSAGTLPTQPALAQACGGWHRVGTDVCYYPSPYRWSSPYRADVTSTKKGKEGAPMVRSRSSFGASAGLAAGLRHDSGGAAASGSKGGTRAASAAAADAIGGIGQGLYGLSFSVTFDSSTATYFFAYCVPYTYSDLQEYLSSLVASVPRLPHILCRSLLCTSFGGNRVDLLTITDFATLGDWQVSPGGACPPEGGREYVLISCRVHPGESNSSWVMKGVLDFLLGPSPRADWLRRKYVFKIIPMINPDGVINGCNRSSLAGNDLNRCWQKPDRRRHPCIYYAKKAAECLQAERRLTLFCDCHGHSRKKDVFMYGCEPNAPATPEDAARVRLLPYLFSRRNSHFNFSKCSFKVQKSKQTCARVVVCKEIGVRNSYTLECSMAGCESSESHFATADLENLGESLCEALRDAGEVVGGADEPQLLEQVAAAMGNESRRISVSSHVTSGSASCPEL